ncbi:hypothetical protein JYU34_008749 [Plutella xylostella]|uniref:Myrosinase 1-like n=1 Tax=Plutella xylostella TaxID=51655 RepID=A0ABQ7QMQ8_PLUXY|nr:hypothetical protein JYU34_008749 [Plutella xylostella]
MKLFVATLGAVLLCSHAAVVKQSGRSFPKDFLFGTATASYQIEGAYNEDGKGENIWDRLTHQDPSPIRDHSNGDIAADSYHKVERDVEMMRELGLDAYRFSLSWSRILPTGFSDQINPAGVDYYNRLINEMLKYNIEPLVTLYHWDLPQPLQDLGGFANPLIGQWFEDYARVVYHHFGDRVKRFITFNEPREICFEGYGSTTKAPAINATGIAEYICAKNLVTAHANAYYLYNNEFKASQGGQVGITISINWFGAKTDSAEDEAAAELKRQAEWGLYAEPIFSSEGGFPKELVQRVGEKSAQQGFPRSRMPEFTDEERQYVRGASDFFGVNHYTGSDISATENLGQHPVPSMLDDINVGSSTPAEWAPSASVWLKLSPDSIYKTFTYLKNRFGDWEFYITENGWSTEGGLDDDGRTLYYRTALESVLDAMDAGVNIKGYMAWSLMDNFEWMEGYIERFGLYEVDFEDPDRKRTPRQSAFVYKKIIKDRTIDHDYIPADNVMTIDEGH